MIVQVTSDHRVGMALRKTACAKGSCPNWAVFGECGHVPLQFYWFKSAVKMYNDLLNSNSETLRDTEALKADLLLHSWAPSC
eukprot:745096-Pelagomonas_calceolata.AAC.1